MNWKDKMILLVCSVLNYGLDRQHYTMLFLHNKVNPFCNTYYYKIYFDNIEVVSTEIETKYLESHWIQESHRIVNVIIDIRFKEIKLSIIA